jgi:putative salt-induced outer membrane protein
MKQCVAPFCLSLLLAFAAQAQEEAGAAADEGPWSGEVSFGYLATRGNADNTNLNTSFGVGYATGKWQHSLSALALHATESKATTAEAYEVGLRSERTLTEPNFLFGALNWRKNRFSGYPEQNSAIVGYGRRVLHTGVHMLNLDVGAGARRSERSDAVIENDFILSGGLGYKWQFSETAEFTQTLGIEYGQNNTYMESISAVGAQLIGNLALVASYTIKYNSDVLPGTVNTDTWTAISLEYRF